MSSVKLRWPFVILAILAVISLFFIWQWSYEVPKPLVTSTAKTLGASDLRRLAAPTGPLPAIDAPLSSIIDDLKARAARGESQAACRLAAEYTRCDLVAYRRTETSQWLADRQHALQMIRDPAAKKMAVESIAREMELRQARDGELESHCHGVSVPSAVDNIANWRNAALLGNPAAVRQYASGNAFRWNSLIQALPQLMTYRGEAERMALQLAASGDIQMSLALADGYDPQARPSRSLLAQTLRPDGGRSLVLYRRISDALASSDDQELLPIKNTVKSRVEQLESNLSIEDLRRSQEVAEREFSQWSAMTLRGAFRMDAPGRQQDVNTASCEKP